MEGFKSLSTEVFDQQDRLAAETFLTEVPGQAGSHGLSDEELSPVAGTGAAEVDRVEDQQVAPFQTYRPQELPGKANDITSTIMQASVDTIFDSPSSPLQGNERKRAWWSGHFLSEESTAVLQDVFWWFFLSKERPDSGSEYFQCTKSCAVRDDIETHSVKVATLEVGAVIEALEMKTIENGERPTACASHPLARAAHVTSG
jgi:hypothetical protein